MAEEKKKTWSLKKKLCFYLSHITVEPTMFLYMFAFMTTTIVEQAFFIDKACRVDHGFNSTICDNIADKKFVEYKKEVQGTVSNFYLFNDVIGYSGQIVLALFIGAWSDKRGRKLPLLLGLFGKLYYSLMITLNSYQTSWSINYIILTATFPMAFTGADVVIFASAFTYLVDVTSLEYRTMRLTILEVSYLATIPTGIALGSYLFRRVVNRSFTIMFAINSTIMILCIAYSILKLKWRTNPKQKPISDADNLLKDFFDFNYIRETTKTICKIRRNNKRLFLVILLIMMSLYTFQREERIMNYLYTQLVFNWNIGDISNFRTFQSALQDIVILTAVPILSVGLKWRDTVIIMIGTASHVIARVFYVTAEESWTFWTGAVFASFGPVAGPVIKSMVSKLVSASERGKALSLLSIASNATPLAAGVLYSRIYYFTINVSPSAFFYLTMGTQLSVFLLVGIIHLKAKDKGDLQCNLNEDEIGVPEIKLEETKLLKTNINDGK